MATMTQLKPLAQIEFDGHITDTYARQLFGSCFDLWADEETLYDIDNNAWKAQLMRHIKDIDAAIKSAHSILDTEYTKMTNNASGIKQTEDSRQTKDASVTTDTTGTTTDGEFLQTQRNYPTGYSGGTDTAYISAQAHDGEFVQSVSNKVEQEQNDTQELVKTAKTDTAGSILERDNIAQYDRLAAYKSAYERIERCVFSLTNLGYMGVL